MTVKEIKETASKDKKEIEIDFDLLDHEITKLRPISVIDGKAWILVYLSAKMNVKGKTMNVQYNNYPYFVTSKKELLNVLVDNNLKQRFQMPDFMVGENVRWHITDIQHYLSTNVKVDLKSLFEKTVKTTSSLVELKTNDHTNVYALWPIGTYFYRLFPYYPMLDFTGSKGSGKTKALSALECLCYNAIMSSKISGPYWARAVESSNSTILIDEQEELTNPKTEHAQNLKTLIHTAFKTDAQYPILVQSKALGWITKKFDVGVPVALSHISLLNDVTADRVIPMPMIKSVNKAITDNEVKADDPIWWALRDGYYRAFLDYHSEVITISKESSMLDYLSGRERSQLWKPII